MLQDGEKGAIIQRDKKTYAVAPHIPCGVVKPETLRKIADVAEKYGAQALKVTSAARIAIVGLDEKDVDAVWSELGMSPGFAVGICVRSVKACPGTTFCKKGMQDSLALGMKFDGKYHGMDLPGKFKIGVSGCPNQCAETCIKDVGLVGMKNGWKVLVGGNGGGRPRLARELAKDLSETEAMELVDRIIDYFKANARPHQRIGAMLDKMDFEEFAAAVKGE
ncbi:Nitrite reductase [NAD(P)H] [Anaerohalosphaera lusitana]|uniref:Nitrite reductase [NAD(P)H] n=1 Tax=Anaerohalosphaera lusitana TaxID=1936003 RepID=A0A1U9NNR1_9BACT|nr:NAD(P)/FAD-dependent oxidoreductase [Anaerohalosphaera lusitana]AQT69475.1 Nitrite reductase [NAD(P)H] [Anaerohalosphaera lusitana]